MQTAETFEQIYLILMAIEKIDFGVSSVSDTIKGFKEERKFGTKYLISIKNRIEAIY